MAVAVHHAPGEVAPAHPAAGQAPVPQRPRPPAARAQPAESAGSPTVPPFLADQAQALAGSPADLPGGDAGKSALATAGRDADSSPARSTMSRSCRSSGRSTDPPPRGRARRIVIPTALIGDRFRPLAAGDRGEPVGRRRQPVPGVAAGRDDRLVVRPDAMAELVLPQVLPHVLDRVQLGAVARQRQEGEVPGDGEVAGARASRRRRARPRRAPRARPARPISARCRPVAAASA